MNQDEFNALVGSARQEYEDASGRLTTRIEALRKSLDRDERRLSALRELYDKRLHDITRAYAGLAPLPALAPTAMAYSGPRGEGKRNKRGALDGPLLELVREVANPVVTVPQMTDAWNQRHGSEGLVSRS
ncbi:MAG TPA: hypothetical protein VGG20_22370, partial [Thermoanaerobaculia bacterium]